MKHRRAASQSKNRVSYRYDGANQRLVMYSLKSNKAAIQADDSGEWFREVSAEDCYGYKDWYPMTDDMWSKLSGFSGKVMNFAVKEAVKVVDFIRKE